MDPTLTVLLYASLAAAVSALGVVPLLGRERASLAAFGWGNAVAAGFMLGAAYLCMAAGLPRGPFVVAAGAALGVGFVFLTHVASGVEELDLNRLEPSDPLYVYKVMVVNWLHSASEGVAIGAAMAVSVPLGIFVAVAMALHNIPEATALAAVLRGQGVRLAHSASLGIVANTSQVLLAVAAFAIVRAAPGALPWALGFAMGSLIYLVLAELLPQSYRQAGHTTIAAITLLAMAIVVLLGGVLNAGL